jgi:hypothetical protein
MMIGTLISISAFSFTIYQYRRKKDEQFTALQSGINIDEEKEKLTRELAERYSRNIIAVEEYEHLLEYINKIETKKSSNRIEKIIGKHGNGNDEIKIHKISEKHPGKGNDFGKKAIGYIRKEIELAERIKRRYFDTRNFF